MPQLHFSQTAEIDAPPTIVYAIIADYRDGHQRILPREFMARMDVEEGGTGAGTVFSLHAGYGPAKNVMRMAVSEPQPGRVLAERDLGSDLVTTFTVDPLDGARRSRVTIETRWSRGGVRGWVERWVAPLVLRPVYAHELALLEQVAVERARAAGS